MLYKGQSKYAVAELLFKRSLAIYEKDLGPEGGPDGPGVAATLFYIAELYEMQGKYASAEALFKRSLAIWEKARGPDHLNVVTSLNNLADAYEMQGKYASAEPLLKRLLAIREKALGPNHPVVAPSQAGNPPVGRIATVEFWDRDLHSLVIKDRATVEISGLRRWLTVPRFYPDRSTDEVIVAVPELIQFVERTVSDDHPLLSKRVPMKCIAVPRIYSDSGNVLPMNPVRRVRMVDARASRKPVPIAHLVTVIAIGVGQVLDHGR